MCFECYIKHLGNGMNKIRPYEHNKDLEDQIGSSSQNQTES